jgi:hypothetical protein
MSIGNIGRSVEEWNNISSMIKGGSNMLMETMMVAELDYKKQSHNELAGYCKVENLSLEYLQSTILEKCINKNESKMMNSIKMSIKGLFSIGTKM